MANYMESSRLTTPLHVLDVEDDANVGNPSMPPKGWAKFVPKNAPYSWLVVNAVLCIWSLLLAIEIAMDPTLRPLERTHLYLVWNFGSCFCWCAELALTALANAQESNGSHCTKGNSWAMIAEFVLAIYFTSDSIQLFRTWQEAEDDIVGEFFDATLATLAYLYMVFKTKSLVDGSRQEADIKNSSHVIV